LWVKGNFSIPNFRVSVRLGAFDLKNNTLCQDTICSETTIDVPVERTVKHESYLRTTKSMENDIALIKLRDPVTYSTFVGPICLPTDRNGQTAEKFVTAGWGIVHGRSLFNQQKVSNMRLVDQNDCQEGYKDSKFDGNQFCAIYDEGGEKCNGDAGGGVMSTKMIGGVSHHYLEGIYSFGIGCYVDGVPEVYTKVESYLAWINQQMQI
jgi:secreted trypsin-like serine protease